MSLGSEYDQWRLDNGEEDCECERCGLKLSEVEFVLNLKTDKEEYWCENCIEQGEPRDCTRIKD